MKAETSDVGPRFNLLQSEGVRGQAHTKEITQVLLTDGAWYAIEPGSFHFYRTGGDKAVPFVQFDLMPNASGQLRVEVFPATVAGWAYPTPDGAEIAEIAEVRPPEQVG